MRIRSKTNPTGIFVTIIIKIHSATVIYFPSYAFYFLLFKRYYLFTLWNQQNIQAIQNPKHFKADCRQEKHELDGPRLPFIDRL